MSARDVIAWTMKSLGAFDPTREADAVLVALHAAGYRILGPGELDAETLERCIKELNRLPWFEDVVSLVDAEAALRALMDQPSTDGGKE